MNKNIELIKKILETTESTDAYLDALDAIKEIESKMASDEQSLKDKDLYNKAEIQNQIRKNKIDLENQKFNTLNKYTQEILPHIDNLKQCLSFVKEDDKNLKLGLEMVILNFEKSFTRMGVEKINNDVLFDPFFHEAISSETKKDMPNNKIIKVMQDGYHIKNKVIRPSKVVVNKK